MAIIQATLIMCLSVNHLTQQDLYLGYITYSTICIANCRMPKRGTIYKTIFSAMINRKLSKSKIVKLPNKKGICQRYVE